MKIRHRIDVAAIMHDQHLQRIAQHQERLADAAADAAVSGNPRRAWLLDYYAQELPRMVAEAIQRQSERTGLR